MRMPLFAWCLATGFVCLSGTLWAQEKSPPAWKKPVEFAEGEPAEEQLVAVPLDAQVYSRTSDDFADLRILNSGGKDVPYRIVKLTENKQRTVEQTWFVKNPSLKPSNDGLDIRFSLDEDDPQPTGVRIDTPLDNFEQRVRVYGLQDGEETLLADEAIFDYSQYMDVRRVEIPLAKNAFRSFRIVVDKLTSEQESAILNLTRNLQGDDETSKQERFSVNRRPFRIDRIGLGKKETRIEVESIVEQDWEIEIENISEDKEHKQTVVEFSTFRQPLSKLTLVTSSRNFGRRVRLEVPVKSGVRETWNEIASGSFSHLKYRDIEEEHLELSFPETRSQTYRLIVENRDSPPLAIDGLEAQGHVHQLLFLAQPEETYELQYGRETDFAERPQYDTVAIERFLAEGVAPQKVQLGKEIEDTRVPPGASTVKRFLNNPVFLGGLVLVMAALLGWGLYGAVKRMNALDDSKHE